VAIDQAYSFWSLFLIAAPVAASNVYEDEPLRAACRGRALRVGEIA
jgi:hypothetical protein